MSAPFPVGIVGQFGWAVRDPKRAPTDSGDEIGSELPALDTSRSGYTVSTAIGSNFPCRTA